MILKVSPIIPYTLQYDRFLSGPLVYFYILYSTCSLFSTSPKFKTLFYCDKTICEKDTNKKIILQLRTN